MSDSGDFMREFHRKLERNTIRNILLSPYSASPGDTSYQRIKKWFLAPIWEPPQILRMNLSVHQLEVRVETPVLGMREVKVHQIGMRRSRFPERLWAGLAKDLRERK